MAEKRPVFDYSNCVGCRICIQSCPFSALELVHTGLDSIRTVFPDLDGEFGAAACIGCGICAKSCPMEAITMTESSAVSAEVQ